MATATLAGLFAPPMLLLSHSQSSWQFWGCAAMAAPLLALFVLSRSEDPAPAQAISLGGLLLITAIVSASALANAKIALAWAILTPIEIAIVESATLSMVGGLFPVALFLGLALGERIGLIGGGQELSVAALLAPPAAVCGALLIHSIRATRDVQRQTRIVRERNYKALSLAAGDLVMHHDASGTYCPSARTSNNGCRSKAMR